MMRTMVMAALVWLEVLRRKDLYVLVILLGAMLAALVSLDVFGLEGATGYVLDVGLLLAWLAGVILAIAVSARQLPQEEARGTIYSLLAKPVARWQVIVGKWLGAWSVSSVALAAFYALVLAVAACRGGGWPGPVLLQAYGLHAVALAFVTALGLLCSARLHHDAAVSLSAVVVAASALLVPRIPAFVAQAPGWRGGALVFLYNILPHLDLLDVRLRVVHRFGPVDGVTATLAAAYGAALTAATLTGAWLLYRRRHFARGTLSGY